MWLWKRSPKKCEHCKLANILFYACDNESYDFFFYLESDFVPWSESVWAGRSWRTSLTRLWKTMSHLDVSSRVFFGTSFFWGCKLPDLQTKAPPNWKSSNLFQKAQEEGCDPNFGNPKNLFILSHVLYWFMVDPKGFGCLYENSFPISHRDRFPHTAVSGPVSPSKPLSAWWSAAWRCPAGSAGSFWLSIGALGVLENEKMNQNQHLPIPQAIL